MFVSFTSESNVKLFGHIWPWKSWFPVDCRVTGSCYEHTGEAPGHLGHTCVTSYICLLVIQEYVLCFKLISAPVDILASILFSFLPLLPYCSPQSSVLPLLPHWSLLSPALLSFSPAHCSPQSSVLPLSPPALSVPLMCVGGPQESKICTVYTGVQCWVNYAL